MDLECLKKAYDIYKKESKVKNELIKAIITNNQEEIIRNQRRYEKLYKLTNDELYPLLGKLSMLEITGGVMQAKSNPEYSELGEFLLLLLSYSVLSNEKLGYNDKLICEYRDKEYFELVKWYIQNHAVSEEQKKQLASDLAGTTGGSVSIRNILANNNDLNSMFDNANLDNPIDKNSYLKDYVKELDIYINLLVPMAMAESIPYGFRFEMPKPVILRLVILNMLTKKFELGFSIEEYITRYLEKHNVICEMLGMSDDERLKEFTNGLVDTYIMEINDITNEFMNQKKR